MPQTLNVGIYEDFASSEITTEIQEKLVTDWSTTDESLDLENIFLENEPKKNEYFDRALEDSFAKTSTEIHGESEKFGHTSQQVNEKEYIADSFTETSTEIPEEIEEYEYNSGDFGVSSTKTIAKTTEEQDKNKYLGEDYESSSDETFTEAQEEPENIRYVISILISKIKFRWVVLKHIA